MTHRSESTAPVELTPTELAPTELAPTGHTPTGLTPTVHTPAGHSPVPQLVINAPSPKAPAASPVARYITILVGLIAIALGVISIREYWLFTDEGHGLSLLKSSLDWIAAPSNQTWMLPAGIACVMVGVLLLYIAVRPRTKTHRRLDGDVNIYVRPVDIARMCTAHAEKTPGVLKAHTIATSRTVTVTLTGDTSDATLVPRVESVLSPLVAALAQQPQLKVKQAKRGAESA